KESETYGRNVDAGVGKSYRADARATDSAPDPSADSGAHPCDPRGIERCPRRATTLFLDHPLQFHATARPVTARVERCRQGLHPRRWSGCDLPVRHRTLAVPGVD